VGTARRSRADARARYGLQRRKLQLTQTALKRPQVDADVMSEKLLIYVSNIGDLPATTKFPQNSNGFCQWVLDTPKAEYNQILLDYSMRSV